MIVVSDTSPITNLAAIGQVDLLRHLYGQVYLPDAVFVELTADVQQPGAEVALSADWNTSAKASTARLGKCLTR